MNTMDDKKLREMLGDLADDVSAHRTVPPALESRVRRRVALNSAVIGTLVIALGVGAFATVRAIAPSNAPKITPATSGTPSTPATIGPKQCTNGQLRAVGALTGAAGSREGYIELRNYSDTVCTLTGRGTITLYDGTLKRISSGIDFRETVAQWQANGSPRPSGWPTVTIQGMAAPRNSAFVRLRWTNWCPQGRGEPLWRISIPGSGTVDVINGMNQLRPPPCNGPGQPSIIEVGPFEPRPVP